MVRILNYYFYLISLSILLFTFHPVRGIESENNSALVGIHKETQEGTQEDTIPINEIWESILSDNKWGAEVNERKKRSVKTVLDKDGKKLKAKKRENRKKIAISAVEKILEEKLEEHLRPLETALQIIRIDSFSEGILRQLSSLELIQSKLLTEYGELRAALNEVGRHTLDLGRQVAGLDERLAALDRQLPHRMDISALRNDFRTDGSSRSASNSFAESQTTEMLKDALVAMTTKISSSERRSKDDLSVLGNRTVEALKSTQNYLDRRLSEVAMETEQISIMLERVMNNSSCIPSLSVTSQPSSSSSDRFFRRPSQALHKSSTPESSRDDLVYLPAEERTSLNLGRLEREERQHPPVITPFTGWVRPMTSVTEVQSLNQGTVSRLASEIAKQVMIDNNEINEARDCTDISSKGERKSGVYTIFPASCSRRFAVKVWCEINSDSSLTPEGWTVIQRRGPTEDSFSPSSSTPSSIFSELSSPATPSVDFFRDWADYKWGFGEIEGEYWLGNEYIHHLTQSGDYDLRIELYDWSTDVRWAQYSHFSIEDEERNYTLHIGEYTGNAGNSLKHHQGAQFSTRDRDNDLNPRGHCARTFHGAWWFTSCHESHLNGRYHKGRHKSYGDGINWLAFKGHNYSLKKSRMMIRPSKRNF